MSIKVLDQQGLAAVLEKLKSLCLTSEDGAAINAALSLLADATVFPATSITIPATGWESGAAGDYAYYKDVAASDVTAADGVDVVLTAASVSVAQSCGLCPTVETLEGVLRFRAASVPQTNLTGEYRILRGPQEEGT